MDVELVRKYYFEDKLKIVEIAKILGVNKSTVSRVLKQFPEYHQEKERRKKENQEKARQWSIPVMNKNKGEWTLKK